MSEATVKTFVRSHVGSRPTGAMTGCALAHFTPLAHCTKQSHSKYTAFVLLCVCGNSCFSHSGAFEEQCLDHSKRSSWHITGAFDLRVKFLDPLIWSAIMAAERDVVMGNTCRRVGEAAQMSEMQRSSFEWKFGIMGCAHRGFCSSCTLCSSSCRGTDTTGTSRSTVE